MGVKLAAVYRQQLAFVKWIQTVTACNGHQIMHQQTARTASRPSEKLSLGATQEVLTLCKVSKLAAAVAAGSQWVAYMMRQRFAVTAGLTLEQCQGE